MKITFLALSAAYAALSVAEAVPAPRPHEDGPKYYFPRVVKRQTEANNTTPSTTPQTTPTVLDPSDSFTSRTEDNGGLGEVLSSVLDSVVDQLTSTPTPDPSTTPGIIIGIDTVITPTTPDSTPTPTPTPGGDSTTPGEQATTPGLGDALSSALDELTSNMGAITTPQGTGNQPTPTPSDGPTPTPSDGGLIPSLSNILSSLTSALTLPSVDPLPTSASLSVPDPTLPTFPTTQPPSPTDEPTGGPTNPSPTTPGPTEPPTQTPPATTPGPTSPPTDVPTPEPTPQPPVGNNTNTEPPVTPTPPPTTFSPSEAPLPTTQSPAQSIIPTGTDNATAVLPPSNIATAPVVPTSESATRTEPSTLPTTMPSDVPRVITPEGGIPVAPENSTLIQIAFKEPLHYEFVVGSQLAVSQIFSYLPEGIADGLEVTQNKVVMQYLQPYNTLAKLHYITTLCMGYIPSNEVDKLSMELLNLNSALYDNPDKSVKTLMSMIDPSVPLLAGQGLSPGGTPVNTPDGTTTNNSDAEGDAPGGGSGSSGVKPSSVGIAVGAVAGAAVYGAAMFLVARRYKKRKAAHQRASSVQTDETPRPGEGTTLMAGARNSYGSRLPGRMNSNNGRGSRNSDRSDESGRSGRTYISPPVMAENSLGWN